MYSVYISARVKERMKQLAEYIYDEFGSKSEKCFLDKLNRSINIIIQNPYSFRVCDNMTDIRMCVVTSQNILYYTITNEQIRLLSLEDTRMNPDKTSI